MVVCGKCGVENKLSGMCKRCGHVNAPKIPIAQRLKEMHTIQKVIAIVLIVFALVSVALTVIEGVTLLKYEGMCAEYSIKTEDADGNVVITFDSKQAYNKIFGAETLSDVNKLIKESSGFDKLVAEYRFGICEDIIAAKADSSAVTFSVVLSIVSVVIMAVCVVLPLVNYGLVGLIAQIYWVIRILFSVWAMGGINWSDYAITFLISAVVFGLIFFYRSFEYKTNN